MAVYINQINKRRQLDKARMAEAIERSSQRMGFRHKKQIMPQDNNSALRQILDALKVTDYELEDNLLTPEEQLTGILRPRGIMMRRIKLTGTWWRECVGPLLGYGKDGRLVALTETSSGLGYHYRMKDGTLKKIGQKEMENDLKPTAIAFTKPLPMHRLEVKDLTSFAWSVVSGPNALMLCLAALVVVLLGMFTPMANKLIFDTVIPTSEAGALLPITGLLLGVTIGTVLLTLTRNLYITRVQHIVDMHTQFAIMARTFLLSPTFFSKHASGELTAKLNNISTLSSMINESIVGVGLSAILSLIYLAQVWIYGKQLLWPALLIIILQVLMLWFSYHRTVNVKSKYTEKVAQLSGLEYNMFAGIQKLKLTGSEDRAFTRWLDYYTDTARLLYNPSFKGRLYPALSALLSLGGMALIFWSALYNKVSSSDYIAFASAFGLMTAALIQINNVIPQLAQIKPLLESVRPILEAVPEMEAKAPQVADLFGGIEISGVSFRYREDGPMGLDDLNLGINP